MSYCRVGYDSDLYIFGTDAALQCYLTYSFAVENEILNWHEELYSQGEVEARLNMLDKMAYYADLGAKVPDSAIQRLIREIEELLDA